MARILCYALGGGLGHIVRTRAVLAALDVTDATVAVLVSTPQAADPRVTGGLPVEVAPPHLERDRAGLADWVADRVVAHAPSRMIVDAFPCGVLGELGHVRFPAALYMAHVARLLRWDVYRQRIRDQPLPKYRTIWTVEDLHYDHARGLDELWFRRPAHLDRLELPPVEPVPAAKRDLGWLIVHSGPPAEVMELAAYADRERQTVSPGAPMTVVCPTPPAPLPPGARHVDAVPVAPYFGRAERIITGGGFNLMRETAPYRDRHLAVPLPRALDDQFTRVARATATVGVAQ